MRASADGAKSDTWLAVIDTLVREGFNRFYLVNGHGGDWEEWPEELRVRQMPDPFRVRSEAETAVLTAQ